MKVMKRPEHKAVSITEGFWAKRRDIVANVTLSDVFEKFEHDRGEGVLKNFDMVVAGETGKHVGRCFYDGLFYEGIRGASDLLTICNDPGMEERLEGYIDKIEAAQSVDPDGYINTFTTLLMPDKRWGENGGDIVAQHDTYNLGALTEAGVHYYKATGKTRLLKCAILAVNCMCHNMGPAPRRNIVPEHSIAEEAIVKLYRLLKEEEDLALRLEKEWGIEVNADAYLGLVQFWMDHRGVHKDRTSYPHYMGEHTQDHCRIEDQDEAVGHAVRAALMYAGLAALGAENGDRKYLDAADRLWENVVQTKLMISGGIGTNPREEKFWWQYDLPNAGYMETCASIALAIWAGEMYQAFGKSKYMDVFEWALYNNISASLAINGERYFYQNPLVSDGSVERWPWHDCPCCPPMILKIMGALPDYIYASGEGKIAVNLFIASQAVLQVAGTKVKITQSECGIPWEGHDKIRIEMENPAEFTLMIRKPAWAENFKVERNGRIFIETDENGYISITDVFQNGEEISVEMETPVVKVEAHPYVAADVGRVVLTRGPLVYCLEEADNPEGVDVVLGQNMLEAFEMELGYPIQALQGYTSEGTKVVAIPYYLWNNRGKGKMNVWLKQEEKDAQSVNLTDWEGILYRKYMLE